MSYDVTLTTVTVPFVPVLVFDSNHTSNTAEMWRAAGCDLAAYDGRTAGELLHALVPAVALIENDRPHFEPVNPENEWGSVVDTTLTFLRGLIVGCSRYPFATVEVHG